MQHDIGKLKEARDIAQAEYLAKPCKETQAPYDNAARALAHACRQLHIEYPD